MFIRCSARLLFQVSPKAEQQPAHQVAFFHKDTKKSLRLCQGHGLFQPDESSSRIAHTLQQAAFEDQDCNSASFPVFSLRGSQEPFQQGKRLAVPALLAQHAREREIFHFSPARVVGLVILRMQSAIFSPGFRCGKIASGEVQPGAQRVSLRHHQVHLRDLANLTCPLQGFECIGPFIIRSIHACQRSIEHKSRPRAPQLLQLFNTLVDIHLRGCQPPAFAHDISQSPVSHHAPFLRQFRISPLQDLFEPFHGAVKLALQDQNFTEKTGGG